MNIFPSVRRRENSPERALMLADRRIRQRARKANVRTIKPSKSDNPEYRKA